MRNLTIHAPDLPTLVLEVDGRLDAVTAHDLHRVTSRLYAEGHQHLHFDLTRVSEADSDGVAGLARCNRHAVTRGRVLTWSRCSRPLLEALHATLDPRPRPDPA